MTLNIGVYLSKNNMVSVRGDHVLEIDDRVTASLAFAFFLLLSWCIRLCRLAARRLFCLTRGHFAIWSLFDLCGMRGDHTGLKSEDQERAKQEAREVFR